MQFHMAYKTSEQSICVYALCKKAINISNSKKKERKKSKKKMNSRVFMRMQIYEHIYDLFPPIHTTNG